MTRKQQYNQFLKTPFWNELRQKTIERDGNKCRRCNGAESLNAHHLEYRESWFDTRLEDLITLCKSCHRKEHGLPDYKVCKFFPYRDDARFNRLVYWIHGLCNRMATGKLLTKRDFLFLQLALKAYPPTENDSCMRFKVNHTLELNQKMKAAV